MTRDSYKFLAGSAAGVAYAHAGYALAASKGIITEPLFLGRKWKARYMWIEAALYSVLSIALIFRGRRADERARHASV